MPAKGPADVQIATMCGRVDDARCWSLVRQLIQDVSPPAGDGFADNVFNQSSTEGAAIKSPPPSPRGRSASFTKSPQTVLQANSLPSPRPIQLERAVLSEDSASEAAEELLSEASASSTSVAETSPRGRKTRFLSFVPPGTESPAAKQDLQASTSTLMATSSAKQNTQDRSNRLRPHFARRHSSFSDDDAYPDPYGISHVERNRQSSTHSARSSNKTSPSLMPDKRVSTMRASPIVLPNKMSQDQGSASGSGSNRPSLAGSARPSLAGSARPSAFGVKKDKSGLVPTSQGWMDPDALDRYRDDRSEPILQWWRSYVDDVSDLALSTGMRLISPGRRANGHDALSRRFQKHRLSGKTG